MQMKQDREAESMAWEAAEQVSSFDSKPLQYKFATVIEGFYLEHPNLSKIAAKEILSQTLILAYCLVNVQVFKALAEDGDAQMWLSNHSRTLSHNMSLAQKILASRQAEAPQHP